MRRLVGWALLGTALYLAYRSSPDLQARVQRALEAGRRAVQREREALWAQVRTLWGET